MTDMKIGAIILAAGLSTRIGEFKPLLTIGPRTFLGHTIHLFATSGINDIVVVTGHRAEKLKQELAHYSCRAVLNENFTDGMFSSVQVGVKALDAEVEAFFLLPVDIPLVKTQTIEELLQAIKQDSSALIFYPEHQKRRGHPPLIRCDLNKSILGYDGQGGLRALFKRYDQLSRNIQVNDPFILLDADTQSDYTGLKEKYLNDPGSASYKN